MADSSHLIRLTGLWRSESRQGDTFLAGNISPTSKLLILPNNRKQRESDPDWIAYLAPPEERQDREQDREPACQMSLLE